MNLKRSAIRHSKDRSQKTQLTWLPTQSCCTNGIFRVCSSHMSSLVCPADARLVVHLVKVVWGWDQPCCTLGSHYFSFPMLTPQGSVLSLGCWSHPPFPGRLRSSTELYWITLYSVPLGCQAQSSALRWSSELDRYDPCPQGM